MKAAVQEIKEKPWNGKTFYSFKAGGEWYSTGTKKPPNPGVYIEFDYTTNPKGFKDVKNITLLQGSSEPQGTERAALVAKAISKDEYWERKEARDLEVQQRIEIQSCRNSAIEFVGLLLSRTGDDAILKMPAMAKRREFVDALLVEYSAKFKELNDGKQMLTTVNKSTDTEVVEDTGAVETAGDWN